MDDNDDGYGYGIKNSVHVYIYEHTTHTHGQENICIGNRLVDGTVQMASAVECGVAKYSTYKSQRWRWKRGNRQFLVGHKSEYLGCWVGCLVLS